MNKRACRPSSREPSSRGLAASALRAFSPTEDDSWYKVSKTLVRPNPGDLTPPPTLSPQIRLSANCLISLPFIVIGIWLIRAPFIVIGIWLVRAGAHRRLVGLLLRSLRHGSWLILHAHHCLRAARNRLFEGENEGKWLQCPLKRSIAGCS